MTSINNNLSSTSTNTYIIPLILQLPPTQSIVLKYPYTIKHTLHNIPSSTQMIVGFAVATLLHHNKISVGFIRVIGMHICHCITNLFNMSCASSMFQQLKMFIRNTISKLLEIWICSCHRHKHIRTHRPTDRNEAMGKQDDEEEEEEG